MPRMPPRLASTLAVLALQTAAGHALALPPAPDISHNTVGWMSNRPCGTQLPDTYIYADGASPTVPRCGTPSDAATNPFDSAMIAPSASVITGLTRVVSTATLLSFSGLPTAESGYVSYPFTVKALPGADVVLNQVLFAYNSSAYGTAFGVRAELVDGATQLPIGVRKSHTEVASMAPDPWGANTYRVLNNQGWPSNDPNPHPLQTDALNEPVPLQANHPYELRLYPTKNSPTSNGAGYIDDVMLFMQAVTVAAVNDPALATLPAITGGTTPSVLSNDTLAGIAPVANHHVVGPDPANPPPAGITVRADGTLLVPPNQPGQYTVPYQLCPVYGSTLYPNFNSAACKTAQAIVTLNGPGPVITPPQPTATPAQVPVNSPWLLGGMLGGVWLLARRRQPARSQ